MTGNFLDRWSRLKRETAREEKPPPQDQGAAPPPALPSEKIEELVKSLPDVNTLTQESDFSVFMQSWVPQDLRRDALRRLWTVEKSVLEHVPLADYALDYNTPGMAPGYGPMIANADMVAEVARMMGRAAFPAPEMRPEAPAESEPEPAAPDEGSRLLESAVTVGPETGNSGKKSATEESRTPIIQLAPQQAAASRESPDTVKSFALVRRRHGAASPQ